LAELVGEQMCSPEMGDRVLAMEVAGWLRSWVLLGEVVRALADDEPVVRRAAVRVLAEVGGAEVLAAVAERLEDPDREVRDLAVEALVRHRSAGLAGRLAGMLTAANVGWVGAALVRMGAVGAEALAGVVVEGPVERADVAAGLLGRSDAATAWLLGDLEVVDPSLRLRAVDVLGAIGGPRAQSGLVGALGDARWVIRGHAARSLGRIGGEAGRDAITLVARGDRSPEVVAAAEEALRAMDDRAGVPSGAGHGT